jgi:hypothetical protein
MQTQTRYYDFRFGERNAGYFSIESSPGHLSMVATFVLERIIHKNVFEIEHNGYRVTAFRKGINESLKSETI